MLFDAINFLFFVSPATSRHLLIDIIKIVIPRIMSEAILPSCVESATRKLMAAMNLSKPYCLVSEEKQGDRNRRPSSRAGGVATLTQEVRHVPTLPEQMPIPDAGSL